VCRRLDRADPPAGRAEHSLRHPARKRRIGPVARIHHVFRTRCRHQNWWRAGRGRPC